MKEQASWLFFVVLFLSSGPLFSAETASILEGWTVMPPPYSGRTIDVVVKKQSGAWEVVGLHDKGKTPATLSPVDIRRRNLIKYQPKVDNLEEGEEIIAVDVENKKITTLAEQQPQNVQCSKSVRSFLGYSLCYSEFSSVDKAKAAQTTAATVFLGAITLGVGPLLTTSTGVVPWYVHFDSASLASIANESRAIEFATKIYEERRLTKYRADLADDQPMLPLEAAVKKYSDTGYDPEGLLPIATARLNLLREKKKEFEYRSRFASAITASDVEAFINTYATQQYDPNGFLPQARERLAKLKSEEMRQKKYGEYRVSFQSIRTSGDANEFINTWANFDPDQLLPVAKKQKAELIAKEREERELQRQRLREMDVFRQSLREGDQTNCGPVIETKKSLVKIYSPVANYGNEHWIRREQLYPSGFGCRFFNGSYVGP